MESVQLGDGVRVNCVYPGLVPTDVGMKLANDAVAFLCSDAARFITGAGLPVDGGMGM